MAARPSSTYRAARRAAARAEGRPPVLLDGMTYRPIRPEDLYGARRSMNRSLLRSTRAQGKT